MVHLRISRATSSGTARAEKRHKQEPDFVFPRDRRRISVSNLQPSTVYLLLQCSISVRWYLLFFRTPVRENMFMGWITLSALSEMGAIQGMRCAGKGQ